MKEILLVIGAVILFANLRTYIMMVRDKKIAVERGKEGVRKMRIPEKKLIAAGIFLGGLGIFLGTRGPFYHKRNKPVFSIWIPILFIVESLVLISLFLWWFSIV